jgi:hypothetical protein
LNIPNTVQYISWESNPCNFRAALGANLISIQCISGTLSPGVKQPEREPSHASFPVLKLRKHETERQIAVALWRHISYRIVVCDRQGGAVQCWNEVSYRTLHSRRLANES